ncbi:MAG: hypothetical protein CEN88_353 [Candidatus Berkelbacteria bacterium Licking1014_2]|uniref:Uncharacterized protein n=1 Tax=Candidatus Berkelbacteria bacterium Licking1014_2 TaxID=2017146 RepID=A0A554LU96_9BACT|nr:MAG: hypothetical protein CEN88_353 [Candidatus Berkelbacteria bacterium Licking1014_2]
MAERKEDFTGLPVTSYCPRGDELPRGQRFWLREVVGPYDELSPHCHRENAASSVSGLSYSHSPFVITPLLVVT